MSDYHLAQVNVAKMRWPLEDPRMHGFSSRLDEINALAERSSGFIWRYVDESGAATDTRPFDDPDILFNLSVWQSVDHLKAYVYHSTHRELVGRRQDWFASGSGLHMALWWMPAGHRPSVAEALERLNHIRQLGPSQYAFGFARPYDPPAKKTGAA